jgi:hypothetical protein
MENLNSSKFSETEISIQKEILTRKETASLLNVNLSTLWLWTRQKKLQSYGIGNKVYYKYSEIINDFLIPLQ